MSEVSTGKLPKPVMRGLLHRQIKINLFAVGVSVFATAMYMKFIFGNGRKKAYLEFYKNYDAEKEFETMRKKGLFDSCSAD